MKLEGDLCAHYLNLDFSENFLSDDVTETCTQLPYPIHKPLKYSKIDIINKFVEETETYNNQLRALGITFPLIKGRILNQNFTDTYATITKGLLNFYNKGKPEPLLTCDYNPFYAAGFLEHICLNGTDYLVRPDCKNNLYITEIAKPWKNNKLNVDYETDENITAVSSFNDCGTVFLLSTHKNEINLLKMEDFNNVEILWKKKLKRDVLWSKSNNTKIGIVTSDTKFQLYNIETKKKTNLKAFHSESALSFDFIDNNNIAILDQKKFRIIDLRSNDHKLFQPNLNDCNSLCSMKTDDNLVYLGSRHHLIRTDMRFFKNVEFCSHLMKKSPCFMDLADNFLCLSGQKIEEKVLFNGKPISSLPLNVPSVCDSLNKCKLQNDILLRGDVKERLGKSVGGIKLITDNSGTFLYSVNSLGDIFKQSLKPNGDDPVERLHHWVNNLPDISKSLHLTNVANLSKVRLALNKRIESENLVKFTRKTKRANYFLNHFKNTYHKNNLSELASNFVSIWEDEEEERDDVEIAPEVAPIDKVNSWIQSSNYFFE